MTLNIADVAKDQAGINLSVIPDLDGVIIGCTAGTGFVNPHADEQYQNAKAANKLLGVYHIPVSAVFDPIAEADFFVSNIRGYIGEALMVLDWEETDTSRVDLAYQFLAQVRSLTGVSPWIYMSEAVVKAHDWSKVSAEFSLWLAQYRFSTPVEGWHPEWTMPDGIVWPFVAAYQYSSTTRLAGWNANLDTSVAYMDADAWHRYATPSNPNHQPAPVVNTPAPAPAPVAPILPGVPTFTAVVSPGDTFTSIAAQFNVPLRELEDVNPGINYDLINSGQVINVPGTPPAPVTQRPVRVLWRVDPGETLSSIAAQTGTTWQAIAADNNIANPDLINVGQMLNIY
jgi:GH25 family lysozyme M1 (1,4-beta-N-acetylmuramidase)/LysM repeat protein